MTKRILFLVFTLTSVLTLFSQVSKDTLKVVNLNSIQVIGVRPSANIPISEKTISSLDIKKDYHAQEISYILEKTPSVTTQSDGGQPNGYTYFRIRGIDQTRINVTLNGSCLNESEDMGAYYSNYPGFANYIKSVQIQRGVGTSSNGTASFGGSINFESKDGLDKGIGGSVTVGSFNTQSINMYYGTGLLKNKLAFFGGLSTYTSDGFRQHSGGTGTSAFFSGGYFGEKNIIKITAFSGLSKNQMAWLPTPDSLIKKDIKTNILSPNDNDNFNQTFIQLQEKYKFSEKSILTNTIFYNNLNGEWNINKNIDPTYFKYNYLSNFIGINSNFKYTQKIIKFDVGYNINIYNRKHFGKEKYSYEVFNTSLNKIDTIYYNGGYTNNGYKNDYSVYFKPELVFDDLTLYGDVQLRNSKFKYTDTDTTLNRNKDIFLNYRIGSTMNLSKNDKMYISVGKSYREPTRTDMFGGNEYYINGVTNINISNECVIDYEFGYKLKNKDLYLNTNIYYMDFKNQYLPTGNIGVNSLMILDSFDKSYRFGLELDGTYKISDNLSISNNTTLSRNRIIDNFDNSDKIHPLYSPTFIMNQDIEYSINGLTLNVSCRTVSKSYINIENTSYAPGYITFNSRIGYSNGIFDLSVNAINLTNKLYYTSGNVSNDGTKNYFVGAPLSFYTTLRVNL